MPDTVHSGSKIRTPFIHAIASSKGNKAPKGNRGSKMSSGSGRY